jgi:hypothetical protein
MGDSSRWARSPPDYGAYWGIASLNANDVPVPNAWTTYLKRLDPYANPSFFLGRSTAARPVSAPSSEQELLAHLGQYRDAGVSYVVTAPGQPLPQSPRTFALVLRSRTAWIYRLAGAAPYFSTGPPGCVTRSEDRQTVRLACLHPTTLLRRELDFPGWSASVDGHSSPIGTADGIYQSVRVPAGRHTVTFGYAPPGIGWALAGLLVGAAWLILGGLGDLRPKSLH